MPKWLLFVMGAALSWGVYVPLVHTASTRLQSNLRAFMFVGVAYLLVAVVLPLVMIFLFKTDPTVKPGQTPNFDSGPMGWGLIAGIAGAVGALCVIFAVTAAGKGGALYVAPLVFAGAPIINTIATITYFHPVKTFPDVRFFLGLLMAAGGAALVMLYKPVDAPHATPPAVQSAPEAKSSH